jgi:hypothetical protein
MGRRDSPRYSFRGFGPSLGREGWFPHGGYRGGVRGGSFGRKDSLACAYPTFEQMAQHWFYLLVLTPVLSHLFAHVLVFEFQVGDLKNIWLIDSGCSRHMTRSLSGVLLLFNRLDTICFLCPSCWMRILRCCFDLVVLEFWILEETLSVWSFSRVRCFELIFFSLLVLSVVSWLILRVSCGSGIGSWVT